MEWSASASLGGVKLVGAAILFSPRRGREEYDRAMTFDKLRRYDVQASYACVLSLVSTIPSLGALWLTYRNYHNDLGQIVYGAEGSFIPAFATCVLTSAIPAAVAFVLGWSSAGQRRNDRQARSWIGFFAGGVVLTVDLILLVAFVMLRFEQPA